MQRTSIKTLPFGSGSTPSSVDK